MSASEHGLRTSRRGAPPSIAPAVGGHLDAAQYEKRIRRLSSELATVKERERQRMAIALHDDVAQPLGVAKMKLGQLAAGLDLPEAPARIVEVRQLIDQAIHTARSLMIETSTEILYGPGLTAALRELGEHLLAEYRIAFRFDSRGIGIQPVTEVGLMLLRIARELLHNVVAHANAEEVALSLQRVEGEVVMTLADDGDGFPEANGLGRSGAFGLFSIREQLRHVGGRMDIFTEKGKGSRIVVAVAG